MPPSRWTTILTALLHSRDLDPADTSWVMTQVVRGEASPTLLAAFLAALRTKGETPEEIAGFVEALYANGTTIDVPGPIVDIVGTGGDGSGAVNISTMASLVVAGAGVTVVKHGGRGSSTSCGSADVVERLGLDLELPVDRVAALAAEVGITFCFAPKFHPGLRHAAPTRRELGVPTVFNVLAPLINPARPQRQLVGVADARMTTVIAEALADRGCTALVVRGDDGLDKLSTTTTSRVWTVRPGMVSAARRFDPRALGIPPATLSDVRGGSADENAAVVRRLLDGERGPVRDMVLLNAAAALVVAEGLGAEPFHEQVAAATLRCGEVIDSGQAADVLTRWIGAAVRRGA